MESLQGYNLLEEYKCLYTDLHITYKSLMYKVEGIATDKFILDRKHLLDKYENLGIEWLDSVSLVEKPNTFFGVIEGENIRFDRYNLIKSIKRYYFRLPTLEEALGVCLYYKLDKLIIAEYFSFDNYDDNE
jgi:hypothetical protein